jgi:hypothetical protein
MERVEALRAAARALGLEITSAVVATNGPSIVEVRWFESVRYYRTSGDFGQNKWDEKCSRGDAREGCPLPAANLRYDFDAHTGAPIAKRTPKRLTAAVAQLVASLDAAQAA